jgi:hypothetical protein
VLSVHQTSAPTGLDLLESSQARAILTQVKPSHRNFDSSEAKPENHWLELGFMTYFFRLVKPSLENTSGLPRPGVHNEHHRQKTYFDILLQF